MGWKDLLQENETITIPWTGSRSFRSTSSSFEIVGKLPPEHGWHIFSISGGRKAKLGGRAASWATETAPIPELLTCQVRGYLVGDRLVDDRVRAVPNPKDIISTTEKVHLIEPGLERFSRILAGRVCEREPLVYISQEFPLGPETDVLNAYLDKLLDVNAIANVHPGLEAAFRLESWQRDEAERIRLELEAKRREEEEKRAKEERRKKLAEQLGSAEGRREMAKVDFAQAAKAALLLSGAEYLDSRPSTRRGEMVVRFRFLRRRFECVVDAATLKCVDAGICLAAHYDDPDFAYGTKGDTWLTLESLPGTIAQAEREGKLVVLRHA